MKERFEPYRPQKTLIDVVMPASSYYEAGDVHVSPFTKVSALAPEAFGAPRRLSLQPIRPGTFRSDWSDRALRQAKAGHRKLLRPGVQAAKAVIGRHSAYVLAIFPTAIAALRSAATHIKLFPQRYTLRRGVQKDLSGPLIRRGAWSAGATALVLIGVTAVFAVTLHGGVFQLYGAHSKNGNTPSQSVAAHEGSNTSAANGQAGNAGSSSNAASITSSGQPTFTAGGGASQGTSSQSIQSPAGVSGGRGGDSTVYGQPAPVSGTPSSPVATPTPVTTPSSPVSSPASNPVSPTVSTGLPTVSGSLQGVPGVTSPVTVDVPAQSVQNDGKPVAGTSPIGVTLN